MKATRFRNPARAFAFCYQLFKADTRFAKRPELAKRMARQVKAGQYLFIIDAGHIVGFTSWIRTTSEQGAAWAAGAKPFAEEMVTSKDADAIVVEHWCAAGAAAQKLLAEKLLAVTGDADRVYGRAELSKGRMIPFKLEKKDLHA